MDDCTASAESISSMSRIAQLFRLVVFEDTQETRFLIFYTKNEI